MTEEAQPDAFSDLVLSRISQLEIKYPIEVAHKKLFDELLLLDGKDTAISDDLCESFNDKAKRKDMTEKVEILRSFLVKEVDDTICLDDAIVNKFASCNSLIREQASLVSTFESARQEHQEAVNLRNKLQDLCHLVQKQIKEIGVNSENAALASKKETEELNSQFSSSIEEINSQLGHQEEALTLQKTENEELREKLSQFQEHITLRSQHFSAQLNAKDLELQLEQAKYAQKKHIAQQEASKYDDMKLKLSAIKSSNNELKAQIELYSEKFAMFEDALCRSDEMFKQFEQRISELDSTFENASREKELRKEICQNLDFNLLSLVDSKSKPRQEVIEAEERKAKRQNECRMLQKERAELLKLKKEKDN